MKEICGLCDGTGIVCAGTDSHTCPQCSGSGLMDWSDNEDSSNP